MREASLSMKTEILIAIGSAVATNCIPCFEHLYEKAITSGITGEEIRRTVEIAGQVKSGAHTAISGAIQDLTGTSEIGGTMFRNIVPGSCC